MGRQQRDADEGHHVGEMSKQESGEPDHESAVAFGEQRRIANHGQGDSDHDETGKGGVWHPDDPQEQQRGERFEHDLQCS